METSSEQASEGRATVSADNPAKGPLSVSIPGAGAAAPASIGGKAWSLSRLASAGFNVPPARVLTTAFFAPWIARIRATPAWEALTRAAQPGWPTHTAELQAYVQALDWEAPQRRALDEVLRACAAGGRTARFAVRSSSPQEDMSGASFAGIYRSCLDVVHDGIEQAVRACFASCLDVRVLAYKAARGLPVFEPAIAVIVQQQVDSAVSGVGFSINPLTNDFDEVVVSASWGLGEAVVDGRVMADQFVLDKTSGQVLSRILGEKQPGGVAQPDGGPGRRDERGDHRRDPGFCLAPQQLTELADTIGRIEALSGMPVDVEFAWAGGTLHVLQARPVTAWVPLSSGMRTQAGAPRMLYMDIALAKGMTINAPVSPLGQDWLRQTFAQLVRHCAGEVHLPLDRADGLLYIGDGRMYLNLSRILWLVSPAQLARSNTPTDALLGATLATVDVARYRCAERPALLPLLALLPRVLWRLRRPIRRTLAAFIAPGYAHRRYLARDRALADRLAAPIGAGATLAGVQQRFGAVAAAGIVDVAMPALLAGVGAMAALERLAGKGGGDRQRLAAQLSRGVAGNRVVDMGIAMFRMSRMLGRADFADLDLLAARIAKRAMPAPFLDAWDGFIEAHGCRGPGEMDLANPGYGDAPRMLLRQMSFMARAPAGAGSKSDPQGHANLDPEAAHRQLAMERDQAFQELLRQSGPLRRMLLRRLHTVAGMFAGTRDTPKHINLLFRQRIRAHALAAGAALAASGRLDSAQDVFGLDYADLETAGAPLDLRAKRRSRTAFLDLLAAQVKAFPALIDSRGRILRAPVDSHPGDAVGQLRGMPISPGVARGPVKCLRTAHGQSIEPGDILVAYTTDPGWTPLFVNAAAVILEVGGVLQHGALVAREFNKPCVAGIAGVLERLRDGQLVEVNGEHGTVTLIDSPLPAGG